MDEMNDIIKVPKTKNPKECSNLKNLFNQIYHKNNLNCFSSIILNLNNISNLFNILIKSEEKEKIEILEFISRNIKENPNNCFLYTSLSKVNSSENNNFLLILIKLYLNENSNDLLKLVMMILETFVNKENIFLNVFQYLYQQLAEFYRKNMDLSFTKIIKYFDLLKILHGEKQVLVKPKNYFYFAGNGGIHVIDRSLEDEKIKLNNGITILLWFNIEDFPTKETNNKCDLISFNTFKGHKIKISLINYKLFISIRDVDQNVNNIKFEKGWNSLTFILSPGTLILKDTEITIIISGKPAKSLKISHFDCDCEIKEMMFFQNFIGQASSIAFFGKAICEDNLKVMKEFPLGLYDEKKLIELIKNGNNNYLANSNFKFKKSKLINKYSESVSSFLNHLRILYLPTRCNDKDIYDVTEKYNGEFISPTMNNSHKFFSLQNNIFYLGGINNILPLVELVFLKNLINEELFLNLCQLISIIIVDKRNNIVKFILIKKNAFDTNFFPMLSIFIEKFPDCIFTEKILDILLEIGNSLFSIIDETKLSLEFFHEILLNERIFLKFSINLQIKMWKLLYKLYIQDDSQIHKFMNMNKIVLILKYYDLNKYREYCCQVHCSIFQNNESSIVMDPEMNIKIKDLSNIIQIVINNLDLEKLEMFQTLVNQLALDISPCLQKFIINILINYFKNTKINDDLKKKSLNFLLKGELLDILLYCYNICLIDVRCDLIKLFKEITNPLYKDPKSLRLFEEKVIPILKECILPDYLNVVRKKIVNTPCKNNLCLTQTKYSKISNLPSTKVSLIPEGNNEIKGFKNEPQTDLNNINNNLMEPKSNSFNIPEFVYPINNNEKVIKNTLVQEINGSKISMESPYILGGDQQKTIDSPNKLNSENRNNININLNINSFVDLVTKKVQVNNSIFDGKDNLHDFNSFEDDLVNNRLNIQVPSKTRKKSNTVKSPVIKQFYDKNLNDKEIKLDINNIDLNQIQDFKVSAELKDADYNYNKDYKLNIIKSGNNTPRKSLLKPDKYGLNSSYKSSDHSENTNILRSEIKSKSLKVSNNESQKFDNLEKFYNKDVYNKYVNELYTCLFEWMLNKKDSNNNEDEIINYKDSIVNEYIIDIYLKLCNLKNIKLIQQFLVEINLLITNNRENSMIFFKNKNFYYWLLDTTFKFYQNHQIEAENYNAKAIFEYGKRIHSELIINTINKEEKHKSEPMIIISNLLSWGIYYKNINSRQKSKYQVNDFIRFLFIDLLSFLKEKSIANPANINVSIWENIVVFTCFCYEFMTFYGIEKDLKLDLSTLTDWNNDIIVPRGIIKGLNLEHHSRESIMDSNLNFNHVFVVENPENKNIAAELWSDYKLFESIYLIFSPLWNKPEFDNINYKSITKIDKLAKDYLLNSSQKNLFLEQLKLLFFICKLDNFNYNINLVKVISNMLSITITLMQEEKEIKYWLSEYERFIKFLIIASSNLLNTKDFYTQVQETVIDIVCFAICFLLNEHNNTKKSSSLMRYSDVITNIFVLMSVFYKKISDEILKKKNKLINIDFLKVLGKKPKNTFEKLAIYRIFNEIIIDDNQKPILKQKLIDDLIQCNINDITSILNTEIWKSGLSENNILKQRCKSLFDFKTYENVIKMRYDIMSGYNPFYADSPLFVKNYEIHIFEKDKFINTIKNIIQSYNKFYKDYHSNQFILMRHKRLLYKSLKKKLFQWTGLWADKKLFYEEQHKLKLKVSNHYTSYYAKPIMTNILDIDYYIPIFTKYDSSKLFLDNDSNLDYRIVLNIDELFLEECEMSKTVKKFALLPSKKIPSRSFYMSKKSLNEKSNKNYIYDIYNNYNKTVMKELENISTFVLKPFGLYEHFNMFTKNKLDCITKKFENLFECCYVKQSHHIKGIFCFTKEGVTFKAYYDQFSEMKNEDNCLNFKDDHYNSERNTCWGSVLKFHHKDKDTLVYFWPLNDIKYVFKRMYYYKRKAIELFTFSNKSYFFCFKDQKQKDQVIELFFASFDNKREIMLDHKEVKDNKDKFIAIENIINKRLQKNGAVSSIFNQWAEWKLSNFELLMFINILSNRSFSDVTQYPVFPWILKNYNETKISIENDIRELNLPMGMVETENEKSKTRKKIFIDAYNDPDVIESQNGKNINYSSHYSSPLSVAHYLTRIFPVVQIHIELQGKFDDANRLFYSLKNTFECVTTHENNVRELIPELFYLPELFLNSNNLNLGKRTDDSKNKIQVEEVLVPKWSNDAYDFIAKMKGVLESDKVSNNINSWIDLIFGFKQNGKEAELNNNVFIYNTYEDNLDLDAEKDSQIPLHLTKIEFGMTPSQVLSKPMIFRYPKESIKRGRQITESKSLKPFYNQISNKNHKTKEKPIMINMKILENDKIMCIYNNNTYNIIRYTQLELKYTISVEWKAYLINNEKESKIQTKIPYLFNENSINSPVVTYSNGKIIAQAGYFDGKISITYTEINNSKTYFVFIDPQNPIIQLKVDKEEKYAFAGSKFGIVYIFKINETIWTLFNSLIDHTDEITSIFVSNRLNVFATTSLDGYLNLYTFPNCKLYRSLKLENNLPLDDVFLSAYPLPCLVVYSKLGKLLRTYSINGKFLYSIEEDCKHLYSPQVFSDFNYNDYLIYGTSTGEFKIRKFPSMNLVLNLKLSNNTDYDNQPIKCIELSKNKKSLYLWQLNYNHIILVKDPSISSDSASVNLLNIGFGF